MPYILISTQIRMECGPTMVGDGDSDPNLMRVLEAKLTKQLGNEFQEYITRWSPRKVLDRLEAEGWKVVAMAGIGQTFLVRTDEKEVTRFIEYLMVQTTTLVKVAAGVFVMGSTGLYLAQKSVQWKVRALPHYNESLKIVFEHPKALEAIGAPISIGSVELSDRHHNYVDKTKSRLRIPVTGLVDCGFMDVLAVRENEKDPFETAKVRLYLNDGVFTIFDTGMWKEEEKDE